MEWDVVPPTRRTVSLLHSLSHGLVVSGAIFLGNTDRSTITRLRAEAEDDVFFMSFSYRLHMLCAKHGPAYYHIGGDAWEAG